MDKSYDDLTFDFSEDEEWLSQVRLSEQALEADSRVDPSLVSCNPLLIPSLLTRARLSAETQRREEKRLALLEQKRRSLRERKPRDKRKSQWTKKQWYKRQRNKKIFNKTAGLGAILRARGRKEIDQELWAKYVAPLFEEYSPEYLEIKLYKHIPKAVSTADGYDYRCYYGTKEYPYTVYTLDVNHSLLGTLYSGAEQFVQDRQEAGNFSGTSVV